MITVINNYIQCDECGRDLAYDNSDTYESWNWNHRYRVIYLDCPKCGNSIAIRRLEEKNV